MATVDNQQKLLDKEVDAFENVPNFTFPASVLVLETTAEYWRIRINCPLFSKPRVVEPRNEMNTTDWHVEWESLQQYLSAVVFKQFSKILEVYNWPGGTRINELTYEDKIALIRANQPTERDLEKWVAKEKLLNPMMAIDFSRVLMSGFQVEETIYY